MPAVPLVNGINYSWANITIQLFNQPIAGITEIDYKEKIKIDDNYGLGQYPISRGFGNIEYEGSLSLYLDEWKRIIASAKALGLNSPLFINPFDVQIVWQATTRTPATIEYLRQVSFMENPLDAKQGETKFICKIPLKIGLIERA